jgi:hypothetical protein
VNLEGGPPADPYEYTARLLRDGLPTRVTAVTAVATYRSEDELSKAIEMRSVQPNQAMPVGQSAVVMGREFLIPDRSSAQTTRPFSQGG